MLSFVSLSPIFVFLETLLGFDIASAAGEGSKQAQDRRQRIMEQTIDQQMQQILAIK